MNVSVPTRCVYFVDGCLVVDSIIGVRACVRSDGNRESDSDRSDKMRGEIRRSLSALGASDTTTTTRSTLIGQKRIM